MPAVPFDDLVAMVAQRFGTAQAAVELLTVDDEPATAPLHPAGVAFVRHWCEQVAWRRETVVLPAIPPQPPSPASGGPAGFRFFAGVPLFAADGSVQGVLCTWDDRPHQPTAEDVQALEQFGRHAATMITLHRTAFELDRERQVLAATGVLLEMIVAGAELPVVLLELAVATEAAIRGTRCSINLLDGSFLRRGAAPSLPEEHRAAIDGQQIGPAAGSCGTAAYTGRTVIVSDIAHDPRWDGYRDLALPFGLRACWSVPIVGADGLVLGTFALYYPEVRVPTPDELARLERWVNLAEVAITRAADITALRTAATRDPLTSLVNRTEVTARIQAAVQTPDTRAAVLFVDLDQFKFVNDTLGHAAGDEFLQMVAQRLTACADPADTVARIGGDEFLVLRPNCVGVAELDSATRRMIAALHSPMTIAGRSLSLSASIGIALQGGPEDRYGPGDLISDADLAMYAAKRTGRNAVAVFTPELRAQAAARLSLEADLNLALANGELDCEYQPTILLDSGRILDVEALLRWNSAGRGPVPPLEFIPIAEASGMICDIGAFVLRLACRQMADWRAAPGWQDVVMWVNVSPRQLLDPDFVPLVATVLLEAGLPAANLGLEVTESTFIDDSALAQESVRQVRDLGVHVAIDDFGTGYSSLAQLEDLPVDVLKIDRRFTAEVQIGSRGAGLVSAIIALAGTVGLRVVAEGVETSVQQQVLLGLGCHVGQGFLWSRPIPAADFTGSLEQFAAATPVSTVSAGSGGLAPVSGRPSAGGR